VTPRLAPLPRDEWDDDARAALRHGIGRDAAESFFASGPDAPPVPTVLGTLLRHPKLAGPFLAYNFVLLQQSTLEHRWRELMVLRVAWRTRADYEWVQHVRIAEAIGISRAEVEAIAGAPVADPWSAFEADLLAATDQLVDDHIIDDATWDRLAAHLDERQLVELVFVVGTYTALAMAFNSFGLELDPELHAIAASVPMPSAPGS
jgi:alkylhydroperoxidase family enzyme